MTSLEISILRSRDLSLFLNVLKESSVSISLGSAKRHFLLVMLFPVRLSSTHSDQSLFMLESRKLALKYLNVKTQLKYFILSKDPRNQIKWRPYKFKKNSLIHDL